MDHQNYGRLAFEEVSESKSSAQGLEQEGGAKCAELASLQRPQLREERPHCTADVLLSVSAVVV